MALAANCLQDTWPRPKNSAWVTLQAFIRRRAERGGEDPGLVGSHQLGRCTLCRALGLLSPLLRGDAPEQSCGQAGAEDGCRQSGYSQATGAIVPRR